MKKKRFNMIYTHVLNKGGRGGQESLRCVTAAAVRYCVIAREFETLDWT